MTAPFITTTHSSLSPSRRPHPRIFACAASWLFDQARLAHGNASAHVHCRYGSVDRPTVLDAWLALHYIRGGLSLTTLLVSSLLSHAPAVNCALRSLCTRCTALHGLLVFHNSVASPQCHCRAASELRAQPAPSPPPHCHSAQRRVSSPVATSSRP